MGYLSCKPNCTYLAVTSFAIVDRDAAFAAFDARWLVGWPVVDHPRHAPQSIWTLEFVARVEDVTEGVVFNVVDGDTVEGTPASCWRVCVVIGEWGCRGGGFPADDRWQCVYHLAVHKGWRLVWLDLAVVAPRPLNANKTINIERMSA